ncbi:MAG: acyl-CoA dehydrogenase family protein, partial [Acidimicrobiales bacterium]
HAGRVALPYPTAGVLLRIDGSPFALIPDDACPVDHGDLFPSWIASHIDGSATIAGPAAEPLGSRLGPFVTELAPRARAKEAPNIEVLLDLTLTAWQILGTLERAVELAVEHVTTRIQFGKPISAFQSVQFQLADASVGVDGLRELCRYTLWRVFQAGDDASISDALALRLAALDTARQVLRTAQQLHGAAGVCDEYDISVLCRHVQPALRLPFGAERTAAEMAWAVGRFGFESLFPHGSAAS